MDIINFENINVGYNEKNILNNLTIKIKKGQHWVILGANGSGKSTFMKLIQSEIHPRFDHKFKKEIFGRPRYSIFDLKKELGIITNDLHNDFYTKASFSTGYEVVLSGYYSSLGIFKYQDFTQTQYKKAKEVISFLGIENLKDKLVKAMSTGQLRKCIIARALIHEPEAFVLDEPTVGLDIKAQINFLDMLKKISKKSSIILVTHHLEEIFQEITHVALLHDKGIYISGKKEKVLKSKHLSKVFDIDIKVKKAKGRYYIKKVKS
jgi:iron complex transport system ATP-binding protein